MAKVKEFVTFGGNKTSLLYSKDFRKKSFKDREKMAFDKNSYKNLDAKSKAELRGYAQAKAEQNMAYRYKKRNKK